MDVRWNTHGELHRRRAQRALEGRETKLCRASRRSGRRLVASKRRNVETRRRDVATSRGRDAWDCGQAASTAQPESRAVQRKPHAGRPGVFAWVGSCCRARGACPRASRIAREHRGVASLPGSGAGASVRGYGCPSAAWRGSTGAGTAREHAFAPRARAARPTARSGPTLSTAWAQHADVGTSPVGGPASPPTSSIACRTHRGRSRRAAPAGECCARPPLRLARRSAAAPAGDGVARAGRHDPPSALGHAVRRPDANPSNAAQHPARHAGSTTRRFVRTRRAAPRAGGAASRAGGSGRAGGRARTGRR